MDSFPILGAKKISAGTKTDFYTKGVGIPETVGESLTKMKLNINHH